MNVYILRHAEAEPAGAGLRDINRPLTPKGIQAVERVLKAARRAKLVPAAIVTSPLLRARQTAEIASSVLHCERIVESKHLSPMARPETLWQELGGVENVDPVLLVGHEPHLSKLIAFLLEAPLMIDLKKGAMVRIETRANHGPPRGVLKWVVTPRLARSLL